MLHPWNIHLELETLNGEKPIYQQIVEKLQDLIRQGVLKAGEALPSSRIMAQQLNISRKTVVKAIDTLVFNGWLVNKDRVGVFVAENIRGISEKGEKMQEKPVAPRLLVVDDGIPDSRIVPVKELARAYRQLFNRAARLQCMDYGSPIGDQKCRAAVSKMLNHDRGLTSTSEEICICRGSQMALYLIARALLKVGDIIVMTNPGYDRARSTFEAAGLEVVSVSVDDEGMNIAELEEIVNTHDVRAIYTTPRHHFPTTVALSPERRKRVVELVKENGIFLIEDDYDCSFHYDERKQVALVNSISKDDSVYIGTFSKLISPSIRLGFLTSSVANVKKIADYRQNIDIQGDNIMEQAVLELIDTGEIRRHVRRAQKLYHERMHYLEDCLSQQMGELVRFKSPGGGMALWVELPKYDRIQDVEKRLLLTGIKAPLFLSPHGCVGIRIGFASMDTQQIDSLVTKLKKALA